MEKLLILHATNRGLALMELNLVANRVGFVED